jgi:hypothetical protein
MPLWEGLSPAVLHSTLMQFKGGYRYPDLAPGLALLGLLVAFVVLLVAWFTGHPLSLVRAAALICGLLGTAIFASAFTPVGLTPPPGGLRARVRWFFKRQGGVTVEFTQWAFYIGLALLVLAVVLGALA